MAAIVTKTFCDTNTNLGGCLRGMGTSSVEESNSDSVGRISWLRPLLLDWLTVRDHTCCPQGHWRCGLLQRLTIIQQNILAWYHVPRPHRLCDLGVWYNPMLFPASLPAAAWRSCNIVRHTLGRHGDQAPRLVSSPLDNVLVVRPTSCFGQLLRKNIALRLQHVHHLLECRGPVPEPQRVRDGAFTHLSTRSWASSSRTNSSARCASNALTRLSPCSTD